MSPRKCCLLLLLCFVSASGFGQSNFDHRQFAGPANANLRSQVDLNKDGIPDLIFGESAGIVVVLSNGNGSWQTPRHYPAGTSTGYTEFAVEDFNRDGNPDVIYANGKNAYLFLGIGDGTLRLPTVIPNTQNAVKLETADFNRDGKVDLIVGTLVQPANAGNTLTVNLLPGNGDGTFAAPKQLYQAAHEFDPSGAFFIGNILAGDFDSDGKADLLIDAEFAGHGGASSEFNFFYGDGAGGFTKTTPLNLGGVHMSRVIDLNRDGRADVVSWVDSSGDFGLRILYGQANRTFTQVQLLALDKLPWECGSYPAVADYNGDGINDIATIACNTSATAQGIGIIYGQPDGTFANPQFVTITTSSSASSSIQLSNMLLAGDYNRDRKPDLMALQQSNGILHEEINTSSGSKFPKCVTLAKPYGISSCVPASGSTVVSPVKFSASALSLSPVRKMEVWVDGTKKVEKFNSYAVYSYLDQSVALGAGAHSVTLFAGGFDNRLQRKTFSFTVAGDCPVLRSPGVNICSPQSSATNPVQINATGRTANKTVWMELWIDGVKKFSVAGSRLVGNITLPVGSHTFSFFAIDSSGSKVSNQRAVQVQ